MIEINKDFFVDLNNQKKANAKYDLKKFYRELSDCERIIIHCTATDSPAWDNPEACINYDLNANHISRSGCPTATYHFYVNKQGQVFQLVSMNLYTWNAAGYNKDSVAVCINHGAVKNNVTEEQYDALIETLAYIFDKLDWSYDEDNIRERIFFHRDLNPMKSCPGRLDKTEVINSVIEKLKTYGDNV